MSARAIVAWWGDRRLRWQAMPIPAPCALQEGHLTDIAVSDRHVVKPWFNGRLAFAPPVPDLSADGFALGAGRLDVIEEHDVAVPVYRRHPILIRPTLPVFITHSAVARIPAIPAGTLASFLRHSDASMASVMGPEPSSAVPTHVLQAPCAPPRFGRKFMSDSSAHLCQAV